jgi:hypothetical protein
MSRISVTLRFLLVFGLAGMGIIIVDIGISNVHGWDWAWAAASVFVASWLCSYQFVLTGIMGLLKGMLVLCVIVMVACGYLLALIAPFSPGLQTQEIGSPLFVHLLIIIVLIGVTFLLLFPLIEPKRRAWLVWRVTQGRLTVKSLYALGFGLIVSASIALWDQVLLLLAKHDVVRFYQMLPKAGAAPAGRVSVTDLIHGNDIFLLLVWQLGDMVPTLKVNDTIGFEQPLFYTSSLAGWLVLAFKVIVGFALIGGILAVVKAERAKPDKPPKVSLLPSTVQWILHLWPRARRARPDQHATETAQPEASGVPLKAWTI